MAKMKKFFKYLIWLILLYLLVNGLTYVATKDDYKDIINYEILTVSPKIEIVECKAGRTDGYVKGKITNDTKEHILQKYIKIDLYDEKNIYLGSEYKEIQCFNVNETMKFDINFRYNNVKKIKISLVDNEKIKETEEDSNNLFSYVKPIFTKEGIKMSILISIPMLIWYILP